MASPMPIATKSEANRTLLHPLNSMIDTTAPRTANAAANSPTGGNHIRTAAIWHTPLDFKDWSLTGRLRTFISGSLSHGPALDALFVARALENGIDEDARSVNLVWWEPAGFDEFFDFGDDVVGGGSHHGIEVARGLAVDEVAPAIAFPRFDEGEIAAEAALHDVHAALEFAGFLAFGDHRAVTSGRVERGDASAPSAQALGECALGIEFDLQLAAQDELLEEFVFADIGGDHF